MRARLKAQLMLQVNKRYGVVLYHRVIIFIYFISKVYTISLKSDAPINMHH